MKDLETWRPVEGTDYEISDKGRGRRNGRILKPIKEKVYTRFNIYINHKCVPVYIHTLVAKAFPEICGEWFEGCCVDHIIPVSRGGGNEATNLRVCTRKENNNNPLTKQRMSEVLKGRKCPEKSIEGLHKPIIQMDIEGNIIREWACEKDACDTLGIRASSLSNALAGRSKTSHNYKWRYK